MEEKGLIERRPNPKDGRGVLIHLTPFGLDKREDSKAVVLQFNDAVKSCVNQEKLDHFFEVVETINQLISEKKIYLQDTPKN